MMSDSDYAKLPPLPDDLRGALQNAVSVQVTQMQLGKAHALVHASCFIVLPLLPDQSVDLIIIDPPYGHLRTNNAGESEWVWDMKWTAQQWQRLLPHVWRVLKRAGRFIVHCVRDFRDEVSRHVRPDLATAPIACNPCMWHHGGKDNARNLQFLPQDCEDVLVFYPRANHKELQLPKEIRDVQQTSFFHPKEPMDIDGGRSRSDGTMKPLSLMRDEVGTFETSGNGVVLDFCMKTGQTGRGALLEGRRFIGVEADANNYEHCLQVWASFLPFDTAPAPRSSDGGGGGGDSSGDSSGGGGDSGGSGGAPATRRRASGPPHLIERIEPPRGRTVARFGVELHAAQSGLEGAGNGLFASVKLSKGTVVPYGSAQHRIYASSADALRAGAPVSHLHAVRDTKHCIDGMPSADVPPGGAELANQPLDSSIRCKLDLNPVQKGLEHCAILTEDVEAGEEIFANYGSNGWSFLESVGLLVMQDSRASHRPIPEYVKHWLYKRFVTGELPQGHVLARMKELFPR